ncbi:unnamed protein product [Lactuca saligna]|uniref:HECT domain-containing protein n=1 Tax=Lactuca saligna TaxID=75948 RepID=A0AA35XYX5_LACSI|nr:unnamed protein product [Lactuca saligna]
MERRFWPKFGDVVQEDVGAKLTMDSTKEIIFERPRAPGTKVEDSNAAGDPLAQKSKGGDVLMVDLNNLEEYISLVVDATIKTGITRQLEAFRAGFNQVFDVSSLQIFSPSELDYLLCGHREIWEADTLVEHIKFDHGYTSKNPVVINLLEIMGEFNPEQQRAFCQFVTGAPRLPPGGLAVLNPKLTIARKSGTKLTSATGGPLLNHIFLRLLWLIIQTLKINPSYNHAGQHFCFYLVSDLAIKELIAVSTNREEDTPPISPNYPFLYNVFFVSMYFVHQVKLVEERNMKPLDSSLAALSARCNKDLELNLAKSLLSEMGECTTAYPYN